MSSRHRSSRDRSRDHDRSDRRGEKRKADGDASDRSSKRARSRSRDSSRRGSRDDRRDRDRDRAREREHDRRDRDGRDRERESSRRDRSRSRSRDRREKDRRARSRSRSRSRSRDRRDRHRDTSRKEEGRRSREREAAHANGKLADAPAAVATAAADSKTSASSTVKERKGIAISTADVQPSTSSTSLTDLLGDEPRALTEEELEYQRRVEEELRRQEEEEKRKAEDTPEARRARRMAMLAAAQASKAPTQLEKEVNGSVAAAPAPATNGVASPQRNATVTARPPASPARVPSVLEVSKDAKPAEDFVEAAPTNGVETKAGRAADDYDMFSDSPSKLIKTISTQATGTDAADNLTDNFDDSEGYYYFRLGDMLDNGRYKVFANSGRGVFSSVMRVKDTACGDRELVVKVIRNNDTMRKAGIKELEFLKKLALEDPEGKRNCVRLISHFEHRNHLCLVFEPLHMNLRQLLKKFNNQGISLSAVRSYAKQMLNALRHLIKCQIVHGDIKPDNILVNETMKRLKLCDFGSASTEAECEITPYLVSRFYRAPEIMLGLRYSHPIDMWSVGCVLFELYTGKILFSGGDNNEMLFQIQEIKGRFPAKLIRQGQFVGRHFDQDYIFELRKADKITGQELREKHRFDKPTKDLKAMLLAASPPSMSAADQKKVNQFADLLHQMFELNPDRRIKVEGALKHPFLRED